MISWNAGAERIKGYKADEIIGRHFSLFYLPEAIATGHPDAELRTAAIEGRFEEEGWRVRKDGPRFFAKVVITAIHDETGTLRGFAKVTRNITARKKIEQELENSEGRLTAILNGSLDGIIRSHFPCLPVVLISGYTEENVERLYAADDRTIFLHKPYSLDQLHAKLTALLVLTPRMDSLFHSHNRPRPRSLAAAAGGSQEAKHSGSRECRSPTSKKNLKPNALICRALSGKYSLYTTISCVSEGDLLLYAGMTLTVIPKAAPDR